jgi:hypothetical protein
MLDTNSAGQGCNGSGAGAKRCQIKLEKPAAAPAVAAAGSGTRVKRRVVLINGRKTLAPIVLG